MNKWNTATLLSLVPGLGHVYIGRTHRGIFVFLIFMVATNSLYLAVTMGIPSQAPEVLSLFIGSMISSLLYSLLHIIYLSRRLETKAHAQSKEYHFKRGLSKYLEGSFDAANEEFIAVLKVDPLDADARFHLAMTELRLGNRTGAEREFRRCKADDIDCKWSWEIAQQLERTR